jgi:hypothetical protein
MEEDYRTNMQRFERQTEEKQRREIERVQRQLNDSYREVSSILVEGKIRFG